MLYAIYDYVTAKIGSQIFGTIKYFSDQTYEWYGNIFRSCTLAIDPGAQTERYTSILALKQSATLSTNLTILTLLSAALAPLRATTRVRGCHCRADENMAQNTYCQPSCSTLGGCSMGNASQRPYFLQFVCCIWSVSSLNAGFPTFPFFPNKMDCSHGCLRRNSVHKDLYFIWTHVLQCPVAL